MFVLTLLAAAVSAETLVLPLEPRPMGPSVEKRVGAWGGYAGAHGPGLRLDGGAGGWEYRERGWKLHADALVMSGVAEFGGSGRGRSSAGGGSFGGAFAKDFGAVSAAAGAVAYFQSVTFQRWAQSGGTSLSPKQAISLFLGLPVAVMKEVEAGNWRFSGALSGSVYGAGAQFYLYQRRGAGTPPSSRKIPLFFGGGASAAVTYEPWRLSLEGGIQALSGSGGAREALLSRLGLAWRWP